MTKQDAIQAARTFELYYLYLESVKQLKLTPSQHHLSLVALDISSDIELTKILPESADHEYLSCWLGGRVKPDTTLYEGLSSYLVEALTMKDALQSYFNHTMTLEIAETVIKRLFPTNLPDSNTIGGGDAIIEAVLNVR